MASPLLILIGADKGGVGKTMLSRALLSYFGRLNVALRVFDTEPAPGVLRRFHADAALVDVSDVGGQMKILDGLAPDVATVVDIRAGQLSPTLRALGYIGLFADVRESRARLVVLHVLGNTIASLSEINTTAGLLADGGTHALVKNYANDGQFFEWSPETQESYFRAVSAAPVLTVPHLPALACEALEKESAPFMSFVNGESNSYVLRGYVRTWLASVCAEFDRVGLAPMAMQR